MMIDLQAGLSLGGYFFMMYCAIYFFYTYLRRSREPVPTLFQPGISVIIPTYNEEANIKKAIDSCLNQDYKGHIEVIVIDDGSTDGTRRICNGYVRKGLIKLILKNKRFYPKGKISSVNLGIKKAKHSLVSILDADSFLDSSAFKELVGHFENNKVGVAVPIMKVYKPKSLLERLQSIEYTLSMCIRRLMASIDSLFMTHGVGCIFRKSALKKVNYFEEKTLTEDLNISLKLIKAGYLVKSSFKAIGYTKVPGKIKQLTKQRLRWNGGLCENMYWFKEMIMNRKYGNLGLFILPVNLAWTGITITFLIQSSVDLYNLITKTIKSLALINFDWVYLISEWFKNISIQFNVLTVISLISLIIFVSFYYLSSKRVGFSNKQVAANLLLMPVYFTVYFLALGVFWLMTPFYIVKNGGVGWSVKS